MTPPAPNLFLIGAPKCATTSLHFYLDAHPEISMSTVKEPQILAGPDYRERLVEYESLFDPGARVRGESSVVYSQYPRWPGVPERIAEVAPEARMVYVVRDPVDRAVAHYAQHVQDGKEERRLSEALADFSRPDSLYVCPSRYATQLRRYLDRFDRSRLLLIELSELSADPSGVLARVADFLGLSAFPRPTEIAAVRLNTREHHRTPTAVGAFAGRVPGARRALPRQIARRMRPLLSRPRERPVLPATLEREIRAELADEVGWLRDWSGRPFAGWSR